MTGEQAPRQDSQPSAQPSSHSTQERPSLLFEYPADMSPKRRAFDRVATNWLFALLWFVGKHWLMLFNGVATIFVGLPFLAPYLESIGQRVPAAAIYYVYSFTCHQMPSRSFFLWGNEMAYCQRDVAIYTSFLVVGIAYVFLRRQLRPLNWRLYVLLAAPLAIDGTLQLIGLYESIWEVRTFTGVLFGVGSVWFIYPRLDVAAFDLLCSIDHIRRTKTPSA